MFRYITCGTLSLRVLGAINFLVTFTNILISSLRYTPLFTQFRRMAWISRTVFAAEEDEKEEENNEEAEVEVGEGLPPKRRERKFIAASSAYELLKLFYI